MIRDKALTTCAGATIAQVCKPFTTFNTIMWYSRPYTFHEIDSNSKHIWNYCLSVTSRRV